MTNLEAKTATQIEAVEKRVYDILVELSWDELHDLAQQCNCWDGSCESLCWYDFDEDFFDTFFAGKPMEAARATFFGNINWADNYIRFNAYGNLVSCYHPEYDEWEVEELAECIVDIQYTTTQYSLDLPCELQDLFDELENEDKEEEAC